MVPDEDMAAVDVYPACAGIDPKRRNEILWILRLPRMRGDRPTLEDIFWKIAKFTPHARGSTLIATSRVVGDHVYPACAGIDPPST